MERLTAVLNTLWLQVPTCTGCQADVVRADVYCFLSCLHFICMQCAAQSVIECGRCLGATLVQVDIAKLAEWRFRLKGGLEDFYSRQNWQGFQTTCDSFSQLLLLVQSGQEFRPTPVPAPVSVSVPAPDLSNPALPSLSGKGHWTCPRCHVPHSPQEVRCETCGYANLAAVDTLLATWNCLCGTVNPELHSKCVGCGRNKTAPVSLPVNLPANSPFWICAVCSYEYNYVQNNVCGKCNQMRFMPEEKKVAPAFPGLWKCECGFANAQSAQVCEKCRKHRFQPAAERPKFTDTAWTCALCRFDKNFRLDICSKCEKPRQVFEPPPPPVVKQAPAANAPNQYPPNWDQMNRSQKKAWKKKNKK